ncbi:glycosyltransferase family 2 protein [Luminiphilus sp.]|nr:glycosyltransferase family 2 protein [Luminiphilus sp.]
MRKVVVVLTFNEELHIARCLKNAWQYASRIVVIDSLSTDKTVEIASELGAEVLRRPFDNQANQFNWALSEISFNFGDIVVRVDADEVFDDEAVHDLQNLAFRKDSLVRGWSFRRRIKFQGSVVKYGGLGNKYITRAFVAGCGKSNQRLMDEHIIVDGGGVQKLGGQLLDDNLNSLHWWMQKHVTYAEREALVKYSTDPESSIKQRIYRMIPSKLRPFAYYFLRYFVLGGVLDTGNARKFHYLQGFVYRRLVEAFTEDFDTRDRDYISDRLKQYGG